MNSTVNKYSTLKLSPGKTPKIERAEKPIMSDSDTCSARESDFEEKKVISLNPNKYSSSNKKASSRFSEFNSKDNDEADQIQFKTYEEYNEEDFTFETVEEVIVEEQEYDGSTFSRLTGSVTMSNVSN
jgi:hypothetical protein